MPPSTAPQRLLLCCAALSSASAGGAPSAAMIADVGLSGLAKAKDHFLPLIISSVQNLTIPGASASDFTYADIHITSAALGSADVSFAPANGGIHLALNSLSLATGTSNFEVKKKIKVGPIHKTFSCSGHFSASVSSTNIAVTLAISNVGGRPQAIATSSINFGKVSVSHHLNSVGCKIAESIISVFIGNVNKKIESEVKSKVPAAVQALLNEQVNKLLDGLQLSIPVDQWAIANFSLAGATTNTATRLKLGFDARFEPRVRPPHGMPPTPTPPGGALVSPPCSEDLGLAFGAQIVNSAAAVYVGAGALSFISTLPVNVTASAAFKALLPSLIKTFPNSSFRVALDVTHPPMAQVAPPLLRISAPNVSFTILAEGATASTPSHPA
jgi:hypothetical protein